MLDGRWFACVMLAAALGAGSAEAQAQKQAKYPDFAGGWSRNTAGAQWDPSKPGGLKQEPPLTPEFQAIFAANVAAIASGDEGYNPHAYCIPAGMPRMMIAYEPLEILLTPDTTYIRDYFNEFRRIFTDGRDWPKEVVPAFGGTSIGHWEDQDGDGRYDTLVVETRGFKGPRVYDATGIPLHPDNQSVIKERLYLDKADHDLLHDEITTFDHALTRPWAVTRHYRRDAHPVWSEFVCAEDNHHINLGKESYFRSVDGYLMPTRKDQPAPDLRYFDQPSR